MICSLGATKEELCVEAVVAADVTVAEAAADAATTAAIEPDAGFPSILAVEEPLFQLAFQFRHAGHEALHRLAQLPDLLGRCRSLSAGLRAAQRTPRQQCGTHPHRVRHHDI